MLPGDMEQPNQSQPASPDAEIARLREAIADLQTRILALERRSPAPVVPAPPEAESRLGLTIFNRVGAVTLAIGVIFFFKYAADNQWIGPGALVILGLLVGFALIGAGEWLRPRQQQTFAQGLAGCGFAIVYISAYAAFAYSKLIGRGPDFIALAAASTLALALCFRFASSAIAAVGFIGAFVAPLLLRPLNHWFVYLFLLSVVSVFTVARLYRASRQISALFLIPFNAFWTILDAWILYPGALALFAFAFAIVHFSAAFATRQTARLYGLFYICAHACLLVAILREIQIWTANRPSLSSELDSVVLAIYGVAAITYGVLRSSAIDRLFGQTLIGIVIVKLYLYDVWLLTRFYRISALVGLGVLLLAASFIYSRRRA